MGGHWEQRRREEAHRNLAARAPARAAETSVSTSTITITETSGAAGVTTTAANGGGDVTIVIVVSTATPNASATLNSTTLPNSTTVLATNTSTLPPPTSTPSTTTTPTILNTSVPDTATQTAHHDALGTGAVAGISVAGTAAALALLALIVWFFRKKSQDRRRSELDMMAPSSFPDPYEPRFAGGGNMPSQGRYEGLDDEDDGPQDGEMSQVGGVSRRRSARSYVPHSPY